MKKYTVCWLDNKGFRSFHPDRAEISFISYKAAKEFLITADKALKLIISFEETLSLVERQTFGKAYRWATKFDLADADVAQMMRFYETWFMDLNIPYKDIIKKDIKPSWTINENDYITSDIVFYNTFHFIYGHQNVSSCNNLADYSTG